VSAARDIGEPRRLAELATAVRESSLKRLRAVPAGAEQWRPTSGAMSFADLAQHLLDADDWLRRKLDDPSITGMKGEAGCSAVATRADFEALVERLAASGRRRAARLAALGADELEERIDDDRFGGEVSRWWVIVRGNLDHEAHHRGQLATYLRLVAVERK
jgi:uncharacterized damage-inducible protein DinB